VDRRHPLRHRRGFGDTGYSARRIRTSGFPQVPSFCDAARRSDGPSTSDLGSVDGTQSGKGGRIEKARKLCRSGHAVGNIITSMWHRHADSVAATRPWRARWISVAMAFSARCRSSAPIAPHARRSGNDIHLVWGPGRHIISHNIAIYHRNADKVRVAFFIETDQMKRRGARLFRSAPLAPGSATAPESVGTGHAQKLLGFRSGAGDPRLSDDRMRMARSTQSSGDHPPGGILPCSIIEHPKFGCKSDVRVPPVSAFRFCGEN
jgi:hypothetical protein